MQQACRNHQETLMLDVMGELSDHRLRRTWEAHLERCAPCRVERQRLVRLFATMRASAAPPELSGAEAALMGGRVLRELRRPADRRVGAGRSLRLAPAMAAAGVMIIVAAAGYFFQDQFFGSGKVADLRLEEQLPLQDVEVIKQLDFLKSLDTIEKLVQVVDSDLSPGTAPNAEETPQAHEVRSDATEIA
jgi:anti-sigma factor RsiW